MNLDNFRITAATNKKKFSGFIDNLASNIPANMPEIAAQADRAVWEKIQCLDCANCCKTMTPAYNKADILRIATHLRMKPKDFIARWLKKEKDSEAWVNASSPCQFLDGNMCTIYEYRPEDCAGFPHHDKQPFDAYITTYRKNLNHCPATHEFVAQLMSKIDLG